MSKTRLIIEEAKEQQEIVRQEQWNKFSIFFTRSGQTLNPELKITDTAKEEQLDYAARPEDILFDFGETVRSNLHGYRRLVPISDNTIVSLHVDNGIQILNIDKLSVEKIEAFNNHDKWGHNSSGMNNAYLLECNHQLFILSTGICKLHCRDIQNKQETIIESPFLSWNTFIKPLKNGIFASGTDDGVLRIWDIKKKAPMYVLQGKKSKICTITQFTNELITTGTQDGTLELWDIHSQRLIKTLKEHESAINCITEYSDEIFLTGSDDSLINTWDKKTNKPTGVFSQHQSQVKFVIKLSNGNILSGSQDGQIKIWTLSNLECLITLTPAKDIWKECDELNKLVELSKGKIASLHHSGKLYIWDAQTGKLLQVLGGEEHNSKRSIKNFRYQRIETFIECDAGNIMTSSMNGMIQLWKFPKLHPSLQNNMQVEQKTFCPDSPEWTFDLK